MLPLKDCGGEPYKIEILDNTPKVLEALKSKGAKNFGVRILDGENPSIIMAAIIVLPEINVALFLKEEPMCRRHTKECFEALKSKTNLPIYTEDPIVAFDCGIKELEIEDIKKIDSYMQSLGLEVERPEVIAEQLLKKLGDMEKPGGFLSPFHKKPTKRTDIN